jgi:hypothetical protein
MRSLSFTAFLVSALWIGLPAVAGAQEPGGARRRPAPAVEPAQTQAVPPDAAVPRSEAARPPRAETPRAEAARPEPRAESPQNGNAEEGSRRRIPLASSSVPATADADDEQQRRGAVRRPPSDRGGNSRGATSPRDRAVVRTNPPRDRDRVVYYYPSYYSFGRYYDPFYYSGFHLGYLAYSPWGWTPAFYGYPYGYGGYGYQRGYGYDMGAVRLKVKPRDAEVYVDGYFAGSVDDFDGVFQSLKLDTGGYRIEIRKAGFETLQFDVHVQPDRTITYRGEMIATP